MIHTPRRAALLALLIAFVTSAADTAWGQDPPDPIRWAVKADASGQVKAGGKFDAQLVAAIDDGWHLYSPEQPAGGPIPTRIRLPDRQPFKLAGEIVSPLPQVSMDPVFQMETQIFEREAIFTLPITVAADAPAGKQLLSITVSYQTCNETTCLPLKVVKVTADLNVVGAQDKNVSKSEGAAKDPKTEGQEGGGGLGVGAQVPDFTFTDFDGRARKFTEFRGKYVLVDFWATWCKPCLADIPHLKELYEKYKDKGFEILGMDSETLSPDEEVDPEFAKETQKRARNIVKTRGASWTHATSETAVPVATKVFGVQKLPTKILIDAQGKIVARVEEGAELNALLEKLLGGKP